MKLPIVQYKRIDPPTKEGEEPVEYFCDALFHRWGKMPQWCDLPKEDGEQKWTYIQRDVAIIEDIDTGEVYEVLPEAIKFKRK